MRSFYCLIFAFFISVYSKKLAAILDGRTGNFPIELDATYSFSNFEWARGYVKFKNGFDVPPGGTIFLGINQPINGPINLNGGTIILEKKITLNEDVSFSDSGYFKTNNKKIFFTGDLNLTNTYYFSDNVEFNGLKSGSLTLRPSSQVVILSYRYLEFENLTINLQGENNNFIFAPTSTGERIFALHNSSLNLNGNLELDRLQLIRGLSTINGYDSLITATSISAGFAKLATNFGTNLEFQRMRIPEILLDNTSLFFRNNNLTIFDHIQSSRVIIEGKCFFESIDTATVSADRNNLFILKSNARLIINPNTHLIM